MAGKTKQKPTAGEDAETHDKPENPGGVHEPLAGKTEHGGRRVDPPGQEDNEHSHRPEIPPGLDRRDDDDDDDDDAPGETQTGTEAGETLGGGAGDDSLDGAAGDDTLDGGDGADQLTGGTGNDVFTAGAAGEDADDLDKVIDFMTGEDSLDFTGELELAETEFATATADSYEAAVAAANAALGDGSVKVVAVQVGEDVIVFGDADGIEGVDQAVVLVGRTLTDVGFGDVG